MPAHRLAALTLGDTSLLDLGAVTEVFGVDRGLAPEWYEFSLCADRRGPQRTRGGPPITIKQDLDQLAAADTVIVLPVARFVRERPDDAVVAALQAASARGARIISLCLGTFVLAAAGLLNKRRATTHWPFCAALAEDYPEIEVVPNVLYVDEGDVMTSGGVAAGIDLCLHLVRKDHGAEVANRLGRALVFGPHRDGGQAQFIEQSVPDTAEHPGPALAWALEHLHTNFTIDQFAAAASMTRRSFYRSFNASTGTTPHRWLVAQRVLRARRLLETTHLSIEQIARHSGFADTTVLRKHLARQTALSPTAYRRTFGTTTTA